MSECKYCKELNEEKSKMFVDSICIQVAGYYNYRVPIINCPNYGKLLERYKNPDGTRNEYKINYGG